MTKQKRWFLLAILLSVFTLNLFVDDIVDGQMNKDELLFFTLTKSLSLVLFYTIFGVKITSKIGAILDSKEKKEWRNMLYFTRGMAVVCAAKFLVDVLKKIFEH